LEQNPASFLREETLSQGDILTNLIICAVILGDGLQSLVPQVQPSPPISVTVPFFLIYFFILFFLIACSITVPVFPEGHLSEWVTISHVPVREAYNCSHMRYVF